MLYSMPLVADDGRRFHLDGFKQIHDDDGLDLWSDTTTLFVTVHEGEGTAGAGRRQGHRDHPPRRLRQAADDMKAHRRATASSTSSGPWPGSAGCSPARSTRPSAASSPGRALQSRRAAARAPPARCGAEEVHFFTHRGRRRAASYPLQRRHEGAGDPRSRVRHPALRLHASTPPRRTSRSTSSSTATTCGCWTTAPARPGVRRRRSSPSTTSRRTTTPPRSRRSARSPAPSRCRSWPTASGR